jgi:hypothetical protein
VDEGKWDNGRDDDDEEDEDDICILPSSPHVINARRGGINARHHFHYPLPTLDVIMIFAHASLVLDCTQLEHNGGSTYKKTANVMTSGNGDVMTLPICTETGDNKANLLPGGAYRWHWIKGGCIGFWKIGEVGLSANLELRQKILRGNPQKRTFVFCA